MARPTAGQHAPNKLGDGDDAVASMQNIDARVDGSMPGRAGACTREARATGWCRAEHRPVVYVGAEVNGSPGVPAASVAVLGVPSVVTNIVPECTGHDVGGVFHGNYVGDLAFLVTDPVATSRAVFNLEQQLRVLPGCVGPHPRRSHA